MSARFGPRRRTVVVFVPFLASAVAACSSAPSRDAERVGSTSQAQCIGPQEGCGACGADPMSPSGCSKTCYWCDGSVTTPACTAPGVVCEKPVANAIALGETTARAPQLTVPEGDSVDVYGLDLQRFPNLVLYVGNQAASVDGSQLSFNSYGFTFLVPPLATTGQVILTQHDVDSPIRFVAPQTLTIDSYRNTQAYRFVNYNVTGTDDITWDDFRVPFGDNQTTFNPFDPCRLFGEVCIPDGIPRPEAYFFYLAAVQAVKTHEHCAGMMLTSARFQHGSDSMSSYASLGSDVFSLEGGGGWPYYDTSPPPSNLDHHIGGWHLAQFSTEYINGLRTSFESNEAFGPGQPLADIQRLLAADDRPIVILRNGGQGHVMTAYAAEPGGTATCWPAGDPRNNFPVAYSVHLADPKVPYDLDDAPEDAPPSTAADAFGAVAHLKKLSQSTLFASPDGSWCHGGAYGSGPWSGGLGDFMVIPASALYKKNATLPTSIDGLIEILTGDSSATQVTDSAGHALFVTGGAQNLDPATRMPSSTPIPLGSDGDTESLAAQALTLGTAGPFVHTIAGSANGSYTAAFFGSGIASNLSGVTATAGVSDTVTVDHAAGRLTFRSGAATNTLTAQMVSTASDGSNRSATVTGAPATSDGDEALAFDAARSAFTYTHGGGAGSFVIALDDQTFNVQATHYETNVTLAPGDVVTLTPSDWSALATAPVAVTTTHADRSVSANIQIDATGLSLTGFAIYDATPILDSKTVQSVTLAPGEYTPQWYSADLAPFTFRVNADGTVDYDDAYTTFLSGRGTSCLRISGFPVDLDATKISFKGLLLLSFNDQPILDTSKVERLTLPPGNGYAFLSGSADPVDFSFDVGFTGIVDYDPSYGAFVDGAGSTSLTLKGYPLTVHLNETGTQWTMLNFSTPLFDSNTDVGLTLLPTGYDFLLGSSEVTTFGFSLDRTGALELDSQFANYARAQGGSLVVQGFPITINATAVGSGIFEVFSLFGAAAFDMSTPESLSLLPTGGYEFLGLGKEFGFVVNGDGSVSLPEAAAGVTVAGATLTVSP